MEVLQVKPMPSRRARRAWHVLLLVAAALPIVWWARLGDASLISAILVVPLLVVPVALYALAIALGQLRDVFVSADATPLGVADVRPRFVPRPVSIALAGGLGVLSSLVLIRGDHGGTGEVFFFLLALGVFIFAPVVILTVLRLALRGSDRVSNLTVSAAFVTRCLTLLLVTGLAHLPRACVHQREMLIETERAKDWCLTIVPRLDVWKESHGAYPPSLEDLGEDVKPPEGVYYFSTKPESFSLFVSDPGGPWFLEDWCFSSSSRVWENNY
jgi:hypothetical protein